MAAFAGFISAPTIYSSTPSNPALGLKDTVGDVDGWRPVDGNTIGSLGNTQPVVEPANAQTGNLAHAFGYLDWYNKIHIQYSVLDMGNLVSTQVIEFEVFSTYFVPRTLSLITATGDDGLVLTQPDPLPSTYEPWRSKFFELQVTTDGPPTISATYVFTFDVGEYDMRVVGQRVVPWFVPPNWQSAVVERIEFRTDVLKKFDGSEQRLSLRADGAQWFWEFRWDVSGPAQRLLENMLYQWSARIWALPIFPQGQAIGTNLSVGATVVSINTANLDFRVGGLAFIQDINHPETFEAFEVLEVAANTVTAKRGLVNAWSAGAYVYPVRTARMARTQRAQRFTGADLYGTAEFRCEEQLVRTPASEPTYRGFPVQTTKPEWAEDPSVEYARKLVSIDLGVGVPVIDDQSGLSEPVSDFRWTFTSRAEVEAFRRWLFARRGRQKAIWLPTFADDLVVKTAVTSGATNIDVVHCGIANFVAAGINRRDIRIEMRDGTVYYRRCSAYVTVDATTERFTIDGALGVTYQPSDFAQVSWMTLSRLDADAVEIAHWTGEVSNALTAMRAPRTTA